MMITSINDDIDKLKEVLDTLPKNNKKNIKIYKDEVSRIYNEYKEYQDLLNNELLKRKKKVSKLKKNENIDRLKKEVLDIEKNLYLLTNSNTSFEKSNLDKNIYNVSKYYKYSLEKVNDDILDIINTFNDVNIKLDIDDFYYSKFLKEYIKALINNDDVKDVFESIYWKCSDILTHAELNFKSLYFKNKKVFDKYYLLKKNNLLKDITSKEFLLKYNSLKKDLDINTFKDEVNIYNLFKNRSLNVSDFKESNIKSSYKNIFNKEYVDIDIGDVIKYYYALKEYMDYLNIKYIIDDAKKLLESKNSYKSNIKNIEKDIKKQEAKLLKLNKVINKLDSRNKDNGEYIIKENEVINKLKELYDNLSDNYLLDRLNNGLSSDTTYDEVIKMYYYNYLYLVKLIKNGNDDITIDEINNNIDVVKNIVLSPYKTFLDSSLLGENKDIKLVFSDCYSLVSYNINSDLLDSVDDISLLRDNIFKIIIYYYINELKINLDDIEFFSIVD